MFLQASKAKLSGSSIRGVKAMVGLSHFFSKSFTHVQKTIPFKYRIYFSLKPRGGSGKGNPQRGF